MQDNVISKTVMGFIFFFIKKHWFKFLLIQAFFLCMAADQTVFPYFFGSFIDALSSFSGDRTHIWQYLVYPLGGLFLTWLYIEYSFRFGGIIFAHTIPKVEADIRMFLFNYTLKHSYSYFSDNLTGEVANKISDTTKSFSSIVTLMMTLFIPVIISCVVAFFFLLNVHVLFAVSLLAFVTIHFIICFVFLRKCSEIEDIHASANSRLTGKIVDSIANFANIKLFSAVKYESRLIRKYQESERKQHFVSLMYMEKVRFLFGLNVLVFPGVIMTFLLVYFWQRNVLSIGEVVTVFNISAGIIQYLWFIGTELPKLFREIGVLSQGLVVLQEDHGIQDKKDAKELVVTKGKIVFDNVHFGYSQKKELFAHKSLTIEPGSKVGLVGFSGSGKSTFVHLIMRFFELNSGKILIDGQNIENVTQDSLRNNIAFIPQDPALFHRSLKENIQFGNPNADYKNITAAAQNAHAHDFILNSPYGYLTKVGERGVKLSGGQRQRIAIARAILKNAPILILDEATSALDSHTEQKIQASLQELMRSRTTIVIAHRLSTLKDMDRLLIFKDGKIIEDGTHEELLAKNGHYTALWNMQVGGFLPEASL